MHAIKKAIGTLALLGVGNSAAADCCALDDLWCLSRWWICVFRRGRTSPRRGGVWG